MSKIEELWNFLVVTTKSKICVPLRNRLIYRPSETEMQRQVSELLKAARRCDCLHDVWAVQAGDLGLCTIVGCLAPCFEGPWAMLEYMS